MYKIVWTNRAVLSLKNIADFYINTHENSNYINKIFAEIEEKENLISNMPFIGIEIDNFPKCNLRKINVLKYFSLIYRITDDKTIDIIYFWDNRQNPEKLEEVL